MTKQRQSSSQPANYTETTIKMVSGSMRGTEVPIKKPVVTLGRSSEADVQVHDVLISRVHCKLEWEDGHWYLEDLASTNGTWMVGRKVDKRVPLPVKTSIRIGNTLFELINIFASDTQSFARPFVAYSIQPETLAPSTPSPDSEEKGQSLYLLKEENQRLAAIYKFQNMIAAVLDEKELYPKILSAVMNVISADAAYLLLYDLDEGIFIPVTGRNELGTLEDVDPASIKNTIVDFVRDNRESVLSIGDSEDEEKKRFKKLAGVPDIVTSIMCVPMLGKRQINGMIYMTLSSTTGKYTEDDLRLLTVIGHTAGMAVENSRLVEFNLRNERLVATGTTAAGLSHYIKNILAGLDGSLNLLQMGIDEKDFVITGEASSILSKNHRRLGNLVLDLLNLASEQKPEFEIYDINIVVQDVVELLEPHLKKDGINIHIDSKLQTQLFAEIDAKGIHRVLLNLISNAEEAILSKKESDSKAKIIGNILVGAKFNDKMDYIIITVSDDGIGLKTKEVDSMFDLFVTSKGTVGTGLGLAVSKRIVTAHEGNITASSPKEKGCTIAFSLPVAHNEMTTVTRTIKRISS